MSIKKISALLDAPQFLPLPINPSGTRSCRLVRYRLNPAEGSIPSIMKGVGSPNPGPGYISGSEMMDCSFYFHIHFSTKSEETLFNRVVVRA